MYTGEASAETTSFVLHVVFLISSLDRVVLAFHWRAGDKEALDEQSELLMLAYVVSKRERPGPACAVCVRDFAPQNLFLTADSVGELAHAQLKPQDTWMQKKKGRYNGLSRNKMCGYNTHTRQKTFDSMPTLSHN